MAYIFPLSLSARRDLLVLSALSILSLILVYHQPTFTVQGPPWDFSTSISSNISASWRPEDIWEPASDWSGEVPVYDNFPSMNEHYASGVKKLVSNRQGQSTRASPFPDYEEPTLRKACKGPWNRDLNQSFDGHVWRHEGFPRNFAEPAIGSSKVAHFEQDDNVDWSQLQSDCYAENMARFNTTPRSPFQMSVTSNDIAESTNTTTIPRTAVILRLHQHTRYTDEIKRNIRSIIQELALYTGAEYAVFMLVEIKDEDRAIWEDIDQYEQAVKDTVPSEFQNITVLWNMFRWRKDYPSLPERMMGVHLSQWLPIQYFRKWYPEFDHYWNWEMDVRFTGHHYDLVKSASDFAAAQPRKGLWERNLRFYIPRLHGTYDQFRDLVQSRYEGNKSRALIWGPHPPYDKVTLSQGSWLSQLQTNPPVLAPENDLFTWGVGEQADLITFLPMFNPALTNYVYRDMYANYDSTTNSEGPSRRATIITFVRISSRLLQLMEAENIATPARHMSSELWPHSLSLHYGLKAVTVPHPIYLEQDWPLQALNFVFNNGDQESVLARHGITTPGGEGAGGPESVFGLEREHNWERSTWYYRNRLARKLFKRWLGWKVEGIGGRLWERDHGRYCLPPMLLHPIKSIEDPNRRDELRGA